MSKTAIQDERRGTSSDKTLAMMDLFTPDRPEWTVEEACVALGQSESTTYRYFRSLASVGLIFSVRSGRYLLGPGIVHYDRQLRMSDPLLSAAQPIMVELAQAIERPARIFISRIFRNHVMAVHEHLIQGGLVADQTFARGQLGPVFQGAPALAMLAFQEVRVVRSLFNKIDGGEGDWLDTKRQMRATRSLGYAVGVDAPDDGVLHVSVPVKQGDTGIAGSLSFAFNSAGHDPRSVATWGSLLIDAAATLAARAGAQARS